MVILPKVGWDALVKRFPSETPLHFAIQILWALAASKGCPCRPAHLGILRLREGIGLNSVLNLRSVLDLRSILRLRGGIGLRASLGLLGLALGGGLVGSGLGLLGLGLGRGLGLLGLGLGSHLGLLGLGLGSRLGLLGLALLGSGLGSWLGLGSLGQLGINLAGVQLEAIATTIRLLRLQIRHHDSGLLDCFLLHVCEHPVDFGEVHAFLGNLLARRLQLKVKLARKGGDAII